MTDGARIPPDMAAGRGGARTAALIERVARMEAALERAGDRVPADARERVAALLEGVRERLSLGVDHTVVALVGGTGSGKSSLFNALSGLDFAKVGVRRPTSSAVTACVWAHDASALLDWLGVDRERRIERESELDGDTQADLRGLVLLDVPDHDSVEAAHRGVVDRLLPQADLLCWVVDPQKYADDALHSGYLRHLAGHEGTMLVVLNQVDTVPEHARAELLADVGRLVRADGLTDVRTVAVSAATGEGLAAVRELLATVVAEHGLAELRATAELHDAATQLAATVGPGEIAPPVARAVDALLEAAGVPGEVEAVSRGVPGGLEPSTRAAVLGPVQADRVALVRDAWLEEVGGSLAPAWRGTLAEAIDDEAAVVRAVDRALGAVVVPDPPPLGVGRFVGWALGAVAVAAGALAVLLAPWWWALATACAVVAGLAPWLSARRRRAVARSAGTRLLSQARSAVTAVVEESLARPTRQVLDDHRAVREASTAPGPEALSTD
ncbi:GTPase [Isoptericola sp. b441]|uniref:GTPase n=1 Tax=Actinotalea lenta TaxID=3064654 RepID=A0ABT9D8K9_9CELL|nr:GTPase [Isoptericola sp. b441]MDO8107227.1 GTPase [Isoptericola sp. b441]